MIKLAGGVIAKNDKIFRRVEQNTSTTLVIAASELLRVVPDVRSVEAEAVSINGDGAMLGL